MEVHPDNRRGSIEQVEAYCTEAPNDIRRSFWGPGVLDRFLVASIVALSLQWGTAAAAVIIVYFTPTVGLGCRSLSYLLYAGASTLVWMLLVTSSILTHYFYSQHQHLSRPQTRFLRCIRVLAILLRRVGKVLAICNVAVIIAACTLQFSNLYDECYCNSSVVGLRNHAYDVIIVAGSELRGPWIGGVALSCGCAVLFVGFVNLFLKPTL